MQIQATIPGQYDGNMPLHGANDYGQEDYGDERDDVHFEDDGHHEREISPEEQIQQFIG
jgi:hypothetical protein